MVMSTEKKTETTKHEPKTTLADAKATKKPEAELSEEELFSLRLPPVVERRW
jgi:hypothetical protein